PASSAGTACLPDGLRDKIVAVMLAHAEAFLDVRAESGGTAWRIADLPDGAERVRAEVAARLGLAAAREERGAAAVTRPVGLVARESRGGDGGPPASVRDDRGASAVLLAPLGRLTAPQVTWVADRLEDQAARITPWR